MYKYFTGDYGLNKGRHILMVDVAIKVGIAVVGAIAAIFVANEICKSLSGKSIWEHIVKFKKDLANKLRNWLREERRQGREHKVVKFVVLKSEHVKDRIRTMFDIKADSKQTGERVIIESQELAINVGQEYELRTEELLLY